ncbi:9263_t:CDS:2, partial [Dentiscutata erythropus]
QKLKNQIRNLKVRITCLKEESTDLIMEIASLEKESTNHEYYLAAEIIHLENEIARLNKLNQEAKLMLEVKFAENQQLGAYCEYLEGNGPPPSNEDCNKLESIFSNLKRETLQKVYQTGL